MSETTTDATQRKFASPEEVAVVLGVSRRTVYRLIKRGDLEGRRVGGQWRVPYDALDDDDRAEMAAV
jgi:excisionase family DNA binding protein